MACSGRFHPGTVRQGHADGHRHVDRRAAIAEEERCVPDPAAQTLGAFHRGFAIRIVDGDEELLAAQTRQKIARAHLGPQTLRKAAQDLVPRGVAPCR
jgi:hypothetical protein